MADDLGRAITSYWEGLRPDDFDHGYLLSDEWMIANKLDARTVIDTHHGMLIFNLQIPMETTISPIWRDIICPAKSSCKRQLISISTT